jgi:hypothetical protein
MDCIFICVFTNPKFLELLNILLESIYTYGNYTQDILIYTTTVFAGSIQLSTFMRPNIRFEICNTYDTIEKACFARLDLFSLASVSQYSRILYLDSDIVVKAPLSRVFDCATEDILYAVEEGVVGWSDHWGQTLFTETEHNLLDSKGFNSGVLLFNNCDAIRTLFEEINADRIARPMKLNCPDQAYIVYHAVRRGVYDTQRLKTVSVNNDMNEYSNKVIHHFPGGPGTTQHKLPKMKLFLQALKRKAPSEKTLYKESSAPNTITGKSFSWENTQIIFTDMNTVAISNGATGKYASLDLHSVVLRLNDYTYRISFNNDYTEFITTCYTTNYKVLSKQIVSAPSFKRFGLMLTK